jgi:hypothetical protein
MNKCDKLPNGNIDLNELKIGRMIVQDPDQWMLGDRWVIEDMDENSITCQLYCCGHKYPWSPVKILKSDLWHYWMRPSETFEEWKKKFEK